MIFITPIPPTKREILATEEITKDDIEYVKVRKKFFKKADVYQTTNNLIGKYVATGTSIPKGGMFYTSQVVEKKELPNAIFDEIPEGYTIYQLKVNETTTYANSIYPGDKIDLWLLTKVENNYVYEPFITNIEVLSVKDSKGQNVFDVNSGRTPAVLAFAVPNDIFVYLSKVGFLSGMSLYPVPINKNNADKDATTEISNKELQTLIDSKSIITNPDNTENNE